MLNICGFNRDAPPTYQIFLMQWAFSEILSILQGWRLLVLWNLDLPLLRAISNLHVLFLYSPGGASSGKSTFIKQLRLHKGDGFPEVERRKLTLHVYENLADALNILLDNMKHLGIDFDHEQHKV